MGIFRFPLRLMCLKLYLRMNRTRFCLFVPVFLLGMLSVSSCSSSKPQFLQAEGWEEHRRAYSVLPAGKELLDPVLSEQDQVRLIAAAKDAELLVAHALDASKQGKWAGAAESITEAEEKLIGYNALSGHLERTHLIYADLYYAAAVELMESFETHIRAEVIMADDFLTEALHYHPEHREAKRLQEYIFALRSRAVAGGEVFGLREIIY